MFKGILWTEAMCAIWSELEKQQNVGVLKSNLNQEDYEDFIKVLEELNIPFIETFMKKCPDYVDDSQRIPAIKINRKHKNEAIAKLEKFLYHRHDIIRISEKKSRHEASLDEILDPPIVAISYCAPKYSKYIDTAMVSFCSDGVVVDRDNAFDAITNIAEKGKDTPDFIRLDKLIFSKSHMSFFYGDCKYTFNKRQSGPYVIVQSLVINKNEQISDDEVRRLTSSTAFHNGRVAENTTRYLNCELRKRYEKFLGKNDLFKYDGKKHIVKLSPVFEEKVRIVD